MLREAACGTAVTDAGSVLAAYMPSHPSAVHCVASPPSVSLLSSASNQLVSLPCPHSLRFACLCPSVFFFPSVVLANMKVAEVTFLSITDALMVCAGYAGTQALDTTASWPYFAFG